MDLEELGCVLLHIVVFIVSGKSLDLLLDARYSVCINSCTV
jgi:hypothetical protein